MYNLIEWLLKVLLDAVLQNKKKERSSRDRKKKKSSKRSSLDSNTVTAVVVYDIPYLRVFYNTFYSRCSRYASNARIERNTCRKKRGEKNRDGEKRQMFLNFKQIRPGGIYYNTHVYIRIIIYTRPCTRYIRDNIIYRYIKRGIRRSGSP